MMCNGMTRFGYLGRPYVATSGFLPVGSPLRHPPEPPVERDDFVTKGTESGDCFGSVEVVHRPRGAVRRETMRRPNECLWVEEATLIAESKVERSRSSKPYLLQECPTDRARMDFRHGSLNVVSRDLTEGHRVPLLRAALSVSGST